MPVTLRAATHRDLDDLLRLAREFYDEDGFATSDDQLRRNFAALLDDPAAQTTIAEDGGRACGFALTTIRMILESGLVAELQDLYVDRAHRRHGVGEQLVAEADRWARAQRATLLEIVVAPNGQDVTRLIEWYERQGFVNEQRALFARRLTDR